MKTQSIEMSRTAFIALLELSKCCGKHLLPSNPSRGNDATREFLMGREEMIEKGWIELDFDGKVCQTASFARMIYTLPRIISSMKVQVDGETFWYLKGPIEQLRIKEVMGNYILTQCSAAEIFRLFREKLYVAECGRVTTQSESEKRETELCNTVASQMERSEKLAEHLYIYFDKEVPRAGDSNRNN